MTKVWGIGSERTGNTRARGKGERRRHSRPPDGALAAAPDRREWAARAVSPLTLGLAAGFYAWMLERPAPVDMAGLKSAPHGLFHGLAPCVDLAVLGSLVATAALGTTAALRPWRERLAVAAGALYLSGASAAAGPIALILAPAIAAAWLGLLAWKGREPRADGMLLATHAGSFGAALSFFHQWAQYRAGWGPFVRNFEALRTLWF